jgi:tetratricopeptide (TPR) repeat protein
MSDSDDDAHAPTATHDPVAALVATGDHIAAARLAVEKHDLPRAISLFERAWRFADALPLALELGDRPLAIRLALDAADAPAAVRIASEIPRDAPTELLAAAASFVARGQTWDAARMAERAGDPSLAAKYFRQAGSQIDVGRVEELAGRPYQAGVAYEQALAGAGTPDEAATAHLALGRLLARLGRHQDAARSFQHAMRVPAHRLAAGRALTAELITLGFRVAATEIVARLRREAPELPDSPDEIAALDAADVAASASTVGQLATNHEPLRQRFKVLHALGAGATSQVFMAEDTLLGHPVALKLLSVGAGARGAERLAYLSFAREAEAAGRLRHPNIVALHDADPTVGLFVFELMSGGTLADRFAREGALPPSVVRRLALDLLSGLASAHQAGIVHRDVKPANVLFDAAGNAKLGDFGAAHLMDFGQTQTGGLLGTVAYMSPEQITGAAIGRQADLYSLGVLLFEVLTGSLPFPGPDIVAQHLGSEPPTAASRRPGLTTAHDDVLLRALRKAPGERWNSAAEMSAAIWSWPVVDSSLSVSAGTTCGVSGAKSDTPASIPDVPLGRSAAGLLWKREHQALGRAVLVEIRSEAVEGEALMALQALAAAGGPYVQRVLALSDDAREVTYELLEGREVDLSQISDLAPAALPALAEAERALTFGGERGSTPARVVLTSGGPVLMIVKSQDD